MYALFTVEIPHTGQARSDLYLVRALSPDAAHRLAALRNLHRAGKGTDARDVAQYAREIAQNIENGTVEDAVFVDTPHDPSAVDDGVLHVWNLTTKQAAWLSSRHRFGMKERIISSRQHTDKEDHFDMFIPSDEEIEAEKPLEILAQSSA